MKSLNSTVCRALLKQVGEMRAPLQAGALLTGHSWIKAAGVSTGLRALTQSQKLISKPPLLATLAADSSAA